MPRMHIQQNSRGFPALMGKLALMGTLASSCVFASAVHAHHPDRENQPVHRRFDLIGPLGNRLPPSYRRVHNRPTNIGGWIAYGIAPSSQEAMAWHRATHMNAYKRKLPRSESFYFYPKPWEVLNVGPRQKTNELVNHAVLPESRKSDAPESGAPAERFVPVEPLSAEGLSDDDPRGDYWRTPQWDD